MSPSRPVNVAALRGAMITTVFAFIWWLAGAGPIPNPFGAGIIIIGAVFALLVWYLARQRLTRAAGQRRDADRPGLGYWLVVAAEVILIVAAIVIANAIDRPHLIPGAVAVLVGLHFIPLGRMFHRPSYQVVALGMAVIGLATIVLILLGILTWDWWLVIPGIGSALVIWTDAVLAVLYPED